MNRVLIPAVALLSLIVGSADASDWASGLFSKTSHDFGTVARAAKTNHSFKFTNTSNSAIQISHARVSCGCTTPIIPKKVIQPGETGEVIAQFNTGSFVGQRGATITVVFVRPTYREVLLRVDGYVRRDIVCNPGSVEFDKVKLGESGRREIDIQYAGKDSWKIEAVESNNDSIQFSLNETRRGNGRVGYTLVAEWQPGQEGYLQEEVTLRTNDRNRPAIPLSISGQAAAVLQVSPQQLFLGEVASDGTVNKTIIVRADEPFRITEASSEDKRFSTSFSEDAKKLHTVQLSFDATGIVGEVSSKIRVATDINEDAAIDIEVTGNVLEQE